MEFRDQDKEIVIPNSLNHNPSNNRESSSKVPSAPTRSDHHQTGTVVSHSTGHQFLLHHHQQLNAQLQAHKPTGDFDPTPDPAQATTPIGTTSVPTPSRSISRSPPPAASSLSVRYRECLKNHAASMGGHILDGCGEFMPGGEEGTLEALKCAACECHRNFHRKETNGESQCVANSHYKNSNGQRNTIPSPHQLVTSLAPPQPSLYQHHRYPHGSLSTYTTPIAPMMMVSFGGGGGGGAAAESSSEDLNMYQSNLEGQVLMRQSMSKKRFRTKFSQEQKDKMMELADKLGWRIQKQDEPEVQQFCSQVGVKRKVFKVWMHNNKQAMKKKQM